MKELAEKNMEYALRLKSRAIYERKRAAFFRDRIDQITHQVPHISSLFLPSLNAYIGK